MRQFAVQLLEARKTKYEGMKQSQKDAGWRDLRSGACVRQLAGVSAQIEAFIQPGGKGGQGVGSLFHSFIEQETGQRNEDNEYNHDDLVVDLF